MELSIPRSCARYLSLWLACVLLSGGLAQAQTAPTVRHAGSTDPLTEGFDDGSVIPGAGISLGPVTSGSPPEDGWQVADTGGDAFLYRFGPTDTASWTASWAVGFTLRFRLLTPLPGDAVDDGVRVQIARDFDLATSHRFLVELGVDGGDQTATVGGQSLACTGSSAYRSYELVYDGATASLSAPGEAGCDAAITGLTPQSVGLIGPGIDFGSGAAGGTGTGDHALVELTFADLDGDGLDHYTELTGGTDPNDADSDDDGLDDRVEAGLGTNPLLADTDADGLLDGEEQGSLGDFGPQQLIVGGVRDPLSVFAADLDGDGDPDVLSASESDDQIAWYENTDGDGSFGPPRMISNVGDAPQSVFAADLDGDGDADVLSAFGVDDEIAWFENRDGNGSFGPPRVISSLTDGARSVFAADLDGDGDADVLSASVNDDKIAWYENTNGDGSFGPQQLISNLAEGPRSVFAADLDGDGDIDVLSASWSFFASPRNDNIAWYENTDGDGSFGPQQVISTLLDEPESVSAADLDGDGDADVLSASWADDKVAWYENADGAGSFGPQQVISTLAAGAEFASAADLDGDGDADVLSASSFDDKVAWYENTDGGGSFGPQQVISTLANWARSVATADLDGDGDADVLSASWSDNKIAWYENADGAGSFGAQQVIASVAQVPRSVYAADLDGDGDRDVLYASSKVAWHENTGGDGSFGPQQVISNLTSGRFFTVFAADLDGDGDADALSASYGDDEIAWYENTDGDGSFGPQQVISNLAVSARSVFAADLDGDGDNDVLSASYGDDKIAWYRNTNGDGSFGPQQVISNLADGARSVFAADLDGDGDNDVLSASLFDDKIAWYENTNGAGSFGPQQVISSLVDGAASVFATDLDGDGDPDVLSASAGGSEIAWYENTDAAGSFGPQQVISNLADSAVAVFAADLDGDGDPDVLSASQDDDEIAWYENTDGAGSFGPQQVISNLANIAFSVFAADLDGDGAPDVLSASPGDDEVAWYANAPQTSDPLDSDSDDDGLCDGGPPGTAPECALGGEDTNGNGVYDVGLETDPRRPDTDGDGFTDGDEVLWGSDPLDAGDFPTPEVPALSGGALALLVALLAAALLWPGRAVRTR